MDEEEKIKTEEDLVEELEDERDREEDEEWARRADLDAEREKEN